MTNWQEAGRKAWVTRQLNDAHHVRDLYRSGFQGGPKTIARRRVLTTLVGAGGTVCLDLWGGGLSALLIQKTGMRVISVDDGTMELREPVSRLRKRRALERTGEEDGYDTRWGAAARVASECDVAFLDFCGPWSRSVGEAIAACRHMKAVAITLTTDHDAQTGSTTQRQRLLAYMMWMKDIWAPAGQRILGIGRATMDAPCRILAHYRRPGGQPVWVFLLGASDPHLPPLSSSDRRQLHPDAMRRYADQQAIRHRERRHSDSTFRERQYAATKAWTTRRLAADPDYVNRLRRERRAAQHTNDLTYRPRGQRHVGAEPP